jgi:GNAT superfamily N-acetyltransferase
MEAVRLREAGAEAQGARDRATFEAWGPPLTLEGYLARERRLRAHRWAQGAMQTWFLEGARGEVLASCETFRVEARAGADVGAAWEVASVYTEPHLRGRGHAGRLMALLLERLRGEEGRPLAVVLFSDVGPELYARAGFVGRPAVDLVLPPLPSPPGLHGGPGAGVDALVAEADVGGALARMRPLPGPVVLCPSEAQVDWHLERERVYCEQLGRPRPVAWGARAGASRALWAAAPKSGRLNVLRLDAHREEEAAALLACAQRVAHGAGLQEVRLWVEGGWAGLGALEGAVPGARRVAREDSLPMLAPLAAGVDPGGWECIPRALWV